MVFATDAKFILTAYDVLARNKASRTAYFSSTMKSNGGVECKADAFSRLSPEQLTLCASYLDEYAAARRRNSKVPALPAQLSRNGITQDFFKTMKYACSAMPHTLEAALEARRKAHNMCFHFGKPSWFLVEAS